MGVFALFTPVSTSVAEAQATMGAIVSEFRFCGATGPADEYVELYNTLGVPLDISGWSIQTNTGTGAAPNFQLSVVPPNTSIPARGHFLFTGTGYSLGLYGKSDASIAGNISDDSGVALLNAAGAVQDAVGFTSSVPVLREGTGLASAPNANGETCWVRDYNGSTPKDTGNSATDWILVSTSGTTISGTGGNLLPQLGAPSPEGLSSPVYGNSVLITTLLDGSVSQNLSPNRVRTGSGNSGTILVRRILTNKTGRTITRVRLTVTSITSLNSPILSGNTAATQADVRLISSHAENVSTSTGIMAVSETSLEADTSGPTAGPSQPNSGGFNSSVSFDAVLATPLPDTQSRPYSFLLQVVRSGNFSILLNIEALAPPGAVSDLTADLGDGQALLTWSAVNGATGYKIERKTGASGTYADLPASPTAPTYTDTGLSNGVTFFYRVYALNGAGVSLPSNEVSVSPAAVVRGVDLLVGAEATLVGDGVLYPDAQLQSVNCGAGAPAIFRLVVKNTGNTRDTFRLSGRGDTPGWKVRYFDAPTGGTEISSLVKPNGYLVTLRGGLSRELCIEVTPDASVPQNEAKDVPVAARSEGEPLYNDQVTARAVQANLPPPPPTVVRDVDAAIRAASENTYSGVGTLAPATVEEVASGASAAIYNWRVQNKGTATDEFTLGLPAPENGWTVSLFDALDGGTDITASVLAGTYSLSLAPGALAEMRLEVKPAGGTRGTLNTVLAATLVADPSKTDSNIASTAAMASVTDLPVAVFSSAARAVAGGIPNALHQTTLTLNATLSGAPLANTALTLAFENNLGHNYGTALNPNIPRRAKIYDPGDAAAPWKETRTILTDANGQAQIVLLSSDVISQPRLIARWTNAGETDTIGGVKFDCAAAVSKRGVVDPALVTNPTNWQDYDTGWSCNFSALEDMGQTTTGLIYMKFTDASGALQPVVGHSLKVGFQSVTLRDGSVVSDQDELRQYVVFIDSVGSEITSPIVTTQADGTALFRLKAKEGINLISSVSFAASNTSQWAD